MALRWKEPGEEMLLPLPFSVCGCSHRLPHPPTRGVQAVGLQLLTRSPLQRRQRILVVSKGLRPVVNNSWSLLGGPTIPRCFALPVNAFQWEAASSPNASRIWAPRGWRGRAPAARRAMSEHPSHKQPPPHPTVYRTLRSLPSQHLPPGRDSPRFGCLFCK